MPRRPSDRSFAKFTPTCRASDTTSAATARHQVMPSPTPTAVEVPTITGTTAAGNVRRRAPRIQRCIGAVCHREQNRQATVGRLSIGSPT